MKKKIRDLTVSQLYEYCKEQESCNDCLFGHFCFCMVNTPYTLEEEALEQEIEIPDEPVEISDKLEEENGATDISNRKEETNDQ